MENSEISQVFKVFNEARLLCEHTDLTITANGTEFKVHKIILSSLSPYFRALFSQRCIGQSYEIPGIPSDILSLIIEFAYTRSAPITEKNVFELLVTADQFLISGLVGACSQFLEKHLCPESCPIIFKNTKNLYSCENVHQKAKQYMLLHFEEVLRTSEEFLELSLEELKEILVDNRLNVKNEEIVFKAMLQWIDHKEESRRKHIVGLLKVVRLLLLKLEFLRQKVIPVIMNARKDFGLESLIFFSEFLDQPMAHRLPSAILFAIGGQNHSLNQSTLVIEVFDVRLDNWISMNAVDEQRRVCLGTAILEEFIFCIGGYDNREYFNSVKKFNLITQTWHEVAPMHERRGSVSATVLDGLIYAIGGFDGQRGLQTAEYYNPKNNQWTLTAQMSGPRYEASATSLHGKVYICGGNNGTEKLSSVEIFDPQSNQWTLIAPMGSRRCGLGVIACSGLVYAVGGSDGSLCLQTVEAYNPLTNIWSHVASMDRPRSYLGIEVVEDKLYAVGGLNGSVDTARVECYDVENDQWDPVDTMSEPRRGLSCCVASGLPNTEKYERIIKTYRDTRMLRMNR